MVLTRVRKELTPEQKERKNAYRKQWRKNNPEMVKAANKRQNAKRCPEYVRAQNRASYYRNKEKRCAVVKARVQNFTEEQRLREIELMRLAKKAGRDNLANWYIKDVIRLNKFKGVITQKIIDDQRRSIILYRIKSLSKEML